MGLDVVFASGPPGGFGCLTGTLGFSRFRLGIEGKCGLLGVFFGFGAGSSDGDLGGWYPSSRYGGFNG